MLRESALSKIKCFDGGPSKSVFGGLPLRSHPQSERGDAASTSTGNRNFEFLQTAKRVDGPSTTNGIAISIETVSIVVVPIDAVFCRQNVVAKAAGDRLDVPESERSILRHDVVHKESVAVHVDRELGDHHEVALELWDSARSDPEREAAVLAENHFVARSEAVVSERTVLSLHFVD